MHDYLLAINLKSWLLYPEIPMYLDPVWHSSVSLIYSCAGWHIIAIIYNIFWSVKRPAVSHSCCFSQICLDLHISISKLLKINDTFNVNKINDIV